jgi:hypothetical protein
VLGQAVSGTVVITASSATRMSMPPWYLAIETEVAQSTVSLDQSN